MTLIKYYTQDKIQNLKKEIFVLKQDKSGWNLLIEREKRLEKDERNFEKRVVEETFNQIENLKRKMDESERKRLNLVKANHDLKSENGKLQDQVSFHFELR